MTRSLALAAILCPLLSSFADVSVPAIFSHHMVLQKAAKVPFWGRAEKGESVTVALGSKTATVIADQDGRWMTHLDLSDSGPGPFEVSIKGKNIIHISDVLVGQVWLASGQSNMDWPLSKTANAQEEIARSANPQIRQFFITRSALLKPTEEMSGAWVIADPTTAHNFTAVGYYFAKSLQNTLKVPVGLINSAWGGTPAEAWTSAEAILTDPDLKRSSEALWKKHEELGMISPQPVPGGTPIPGTRAREYTSSYLFNGMINPLIPYAIKGVIWYQGESNTGTGFQYRKTFPLLITDWRAKWQQGDFPFYFCQLANFNPKVTEHQENGWPEVREAQSMTLSLPNTGQAVLIDIGEAGDIHPINKKEVGDRLARIALAKDYGQKIAYSGPVYQSMKAKDGKIHLTFDQINGGLVARPLPETYDVKLLQNQRAPLVRNSPNSELEGFEICGEDKKWAWADAKIEGETVVVWSDSVPKPIAVRYGWATNPTVNLYNQAGLPASPFRTDDFPTHTVNMKY